MSVSKVGLIIQARIGSTRLPAKMTVPFYKGKGIFELLIQRIQEEFSPKEMVLATSDHHRDEVLVRIADRNGIAVYRGSENDVLHRFIEASHQMKFTDAIRICADNPFLDVAALKEVRDCHLKSNADYSAFRMADGTPSIRTHFGFWGEGVKVEALEKVQQLTSDSFYREHVTNYLYRHPDLFSFYWINIDKEIEKEHGRLRFTLDTQGDFDRLKKLFNQWVHTKGSTRELIYITKKNSTLVNEMIQEIKKQTK